MNHGFSPALAGIQKYQTQRFQHGLMQSSKPTDVPDSPALKPTRKRTAVVRAYGGVGPEERKAERRKRLLDAALVVFGQHGYHDATVRQICSEAKLTERYFYESFKGMSELFQALYTQLNGELMPLTMAALAASPYEPMALVEAALRSFYGYIENNPARARVLLIDTVSINARTTNTANDVVRDYGSLLRQFITVFYPDLKSLGIDVGLVVSGLIGSTIHVATHWARGHFNKSLDQVVAAGLMQYQGTHMRYLQIKEEAARAAAKAPSEAVS